MADVRKLWIEGPVGKLEAAMRVACPARAAITIAHPHPRYGGTLHNPVVFHCDRELNRKGLTTLRFNFRGTGASDGTHDGGRGEVEDVGAAVSWLRGAAPGVPLLVGGYSFGGWCSLRHAVSDRSITAVLAIGLPVRLYEMKEVEALGRPIAVVQGSADEFGSPDEVEVVLGTGTPAGRVYVVPDTGHAFRGRVRDTAARVVEAVLDLLTASGRPPARERRSS